MQSPGSSKLINYHLTLSPKPGDGYIARVALGTIIVIRRCELCAIKLQEAPRALPGFIRSSSVAVNEAALVRNFVRIREGCSHSRIVYYIDSTLWGSAWLCDFTDWIETIE